MSRAIRWPRGNCERRWSKRKRIQKKRIEESWWAKESAGRRLAVVLGRFKNSLYHLPPLTHDRELTVSILQLLCSHLILIPDLLRSTSVAVAMYFNGNPFTIDDRCYCAHTTRMSRVRFGKALLKQDRWSRRKYAGGMNLQFEFIKLDSYRDFY